MISGKRILLPCVVIGRDMLSSRFIEAIVGEPSY